ncbi:MAG: T9SS type A sorting domain-containing protein [Opitutaceae bacterium]|nr:T9SS type A sorting domain-containing protein [Cytophagales bacterium]
MKKFFQIIILTSSIAFAQAQNAQTDVTINIPDPNFLKALIGNKIDINNNGSIQFSEATSVLRLDVNNKNISSLKGIEFFNSLTYLNCGQNNLSSLDMGDKPKLDTLYCASNVLTYLNVTKCPKLTSLFFSINNLTTIDLSGNPKLKEIYGDLNKIQTLDLSLNKELEIVIMENNKLQFVNLTDSRKLTAVNFNGNYLSTLDLTVNKKLEFLIVNNNNFTNLDLSSLKSLQHGYMLGNPIKAICIPSGFDTSLLAVDNKPKVNFTLCNTITGVAELLVEPSRQFYPNPATNVIFIDKSINGVKIYNLQGELIDVTSNKSIDISFLPKGVFLVEMEDISGKISKTKFIKE